jgi:hypothetical protein
MQGEAAKKKETDAIPSLEETKLRPASDQFQLEYQQLVAVSFSLQFANPSRISPGSEINDGILASESLKG